MKNRFIPYEHAKMMKELGFDEECLKVYDARMDRVILREPTYSQAEEWLWEKHKIIIEIQDISTRSKEELGEIYESECSIRDGLGELIDVLENESPIIAHREGILKAIEFKYEELIGKKPKQ